MHTFQVFMHWFQVFKFWSIVVFLFVGSFTSKVCFRGGISNLRKDTNNTEGATDLKNSFGSNSIITCHHEHATTHTHTNLFIILFSDGKQLIPVQNINNALLLFLFSTPPSPPKQISKHAQEQKIRNTDTLSLTRVTHTIFSDADR